MPANLKDSEQHSVLIDGNPFSYRTIGAGKPLLMIHGWPFHGKTFLALAEHLREDFHCFIVDLPGLGKSGHSEKTDFSFTGLARIVRKFADEAIGSDYFCIAHDTGATVARFLALEDMRMKKLVLLDTEIPGHRPPWIELFQFLFAIPGAAFIFKALLQQDFFLRSSMGYGGCFENKALIDDAFRTDYVTPLIQETDRLEGAIRYLRAIDFQLMDSLAHRHQNLNIPVSMIWGSNDEIFPASEARTMIGQFKHLDGFHAVSETKLMLHVEKPREVATIAAAFLKK